MEKFNLNLGETEMNGFDSIIIVKDNGDIPCGVSIDCSALAAGTTVLKAGHVITVDGGSHAALAITEGAYASVTSKTVAGILKHDTVIRDGVAMGAVLVSGVVNAAAAAKHVGAPYTDGIKKALTSVAFLYSE